MTHLIQPFGADEGLPPYTGVHLYPSNLPITFLALGDISMYNECPTASGLIEDFASETMSLRVKILPDHCYTDRKNGPGS